MCLKLLLIMQLLPVGLLVSLREAGIFETLRRMTQVKQHPSNY